MFLNVVNLEKWASFFRQENTQRSFPITIKIMFGSSVFTCVSIYDNGQV